MPKLDLDALVLKRGWHEPPNNGLVDACVMEAVAYVAGEPWTDRPQCASPVITEFLIAWNDALSDDDRQMLKAYIPRLVGTRTTKKDEEKRAWLVTDWLARECAPAWLRLAGLTVQAERLEALAPVLSASAARRAQPSLAAARAAARISPPPRLELFARRQRLGWDTWGNEALEHVEIGA